MPNAFDVDLVAGGFLPPLVRSFVEGRERDLLAPLGLVAPELSSSSRAAEALAGRPAPAVDRRALARGIGTMNVAYGHPAARELAARLSDPATRVVVTGQQPGLFGGPLYSLSKAVAAARWAAALEAAGEPAVAVFWVATEDHDYAEVARAALPGRDGPLELALEPDPQPLVPVGQRTFGPTVDSALDSAREVTGDLGAAQWDAVARYYRPDARFGEAFPRQLIQLLGEHAPLMLDAQLSELKVAERDWMLRLVERRDEVEKAIAAAEREIEKRGFDLQVAPQPGLSPLFLLDGNERRRIEWRGADGWSLRGSETGGSIADLVSHIADNPIVASPGVLARPVVQDAVLGTSLQVMGPGELSYLAQVAPLYGVLEVEAPWTSLRPQVVVLDDKQRGWLEDSEVSLALLLGPREELDAVLAARAGDNPVEPVRRRVSEELAGLRDGVLAVDPTLERPWQKTRDQIDRALDTLAGKLTAAAARSDEVLRRRIDALRDAALPGGTLQERKITASYFAARFGPGFAAELYEQMDLDPRRLGVVVPSPPEGP